MTLTAAECFGKYQGSRRANPKESHEAIFIRSKTLQGLKITSKKRILRPEKVPLHTKRLPN